MKTKSTEGPGRFIKLACAGAVALALGACATVTDYDQDVVKRVEEQKLGPKQAPTRTVTSFASALRCMDIMFMTYGVRDIGVLIEDIPDSTSKVRAGAKDMIISAVSQMSRRSRGIRLVAFSITDQTLGAVVGFGTRDKVIDNTPDFTIRGSISQFDESLVRKQGDAGIGIGAVSAGVAKQGSGSVLALDLSMIDTNELVLIPGVVSKNSVLVLKQGSGTDGEVNTRKFGLNFSFTMSKSEGTAQALRTLSELAIIELFGKLTKIPYWTCLGATDEEPLVLTELTDWWETLAAEPISLVAYFQQQMRARGLYEGDVTGEVDDGLLQAIAVYQQAMGREPSPTLDFEFFKSYLKTDHAAVQQKALAIRQGGDVGLTVAPTAAPAGTPQATDNIAGSASTQQVPFVYIGGMQGKNTVHTRGQPFAIDVAIDQDAYLYCYLLDERGRVNQFFPNPVQTNPAVAAGTRLKFPGSLPFRFIASPTGGQESIACFAAKQPVGTEPLKTLAVAKSTEEIHSAFRQKAGPGVGVGVGVYDVQVQ